MAEQLSATAGRCESTRCLTTGELRLSLTGEEEEEEGEEEEGVAAGLSAMEAEFREIDENGSWSAIYQVGPLGK